MNIPPRVNIAHLPTPVESLPRLSKELGGPNLLLKRDDQTGLALGGNKTRKLEFLIADAQQRNARTLITAGAIQSNHCRQTAAAAARFGFECILVLTGEPPDKATGNLILDRMMGAELIWTDKDSREQVLEEAHAEAQERGRAPYLIPYGGSNPLGALSYALAIQELIGQSVQPDWVVVPSSSGGTQAGMVLGARYFNLHGEILGISIDETAGDLKQRVASLATDTSELLGEQTMFLAQEVQVNDRFLGAGYGEMGDLEREAVALFARHEGILLDPVYTGRAAGGMIELIRDGYFPVDSTVLFWHTGGTPALFAEKYSSSL